MANDNQTALMQSIQRKKDRLLELKQQLLYSNSTGFTYESNINARIDELKDQITEDEKLLAVDREHLEDAFTQGAICMSQAKEGEDPNYAHGEDYYNQKYGTDGK